MDQKERSKLVRKLKAKIMTEIEDEKTKLKKVVEEKLYNPLDEAYRQCVKDLAALYLLEQNLTDNKVFVRLNTYGNYTLSDNTINIMLLSNFNVALHFIYSVRQTETSKGIFDINADIDKYLENNLINPFERIVFRQFL